MRLAPFASNDDTARRIPLGWRSLAFLARPVVGHGGWQSLLRRLQAGVCDGELICRTRDLDALVRHCSGVHHGGWQQRARAIIVDSQLQHLGVLPERRRPRLHVVKGGGNGR